MSDETCARNEGAKDVPVMYDMDCAPLDGTLVQLLVRFDHNGIEDTNEPTWTIGSHNDGEWNFVGWCWHTDEWARGSGDLIGWLPFKPGIQPVDHQRSGQAASGPSQGARSDEAVKRFGTKPWSTLARLKDDEDLELYVRARIEAEGVGGGQPEAPTAAPRRTTGWVAPKDRYVPPVLFNPYNGEPRNVHDVQNDPQGILIVPPGALMLAAPPARSGAGSEEGQG